MRVAFNVDQSSEITEANSCLVDSMQLHGDYKNINTTFPDIVFLHCKPGEKFHVPLMKLNIPDSPLEVDSFKQLYYLGYKAGSYFKGSYDFPMRVDLSSLIDSPDFETSKHAVISHPLIYYNNILLPAATNLQIYSYLGQHSIASTNTIINAIYLPSLIDKCLIFIQAIVLPSTVTPPQGEAYQDRTAFLLIHINNFPRYIPIVHGFTVVIPHKCSSDYMLTTLETGDGCSGGGYFLQSGEFVALHCGRLTESAAFHFPLHCSVFLNAHWITEHLDISALELESRFEETKKISIRTLMETQTLFQQAQASYRFVKAKIYHNKSLLGDLNSIRNESFGCSFQLVSSDSKTTTYNLFSGNESSFFDEFGNEFHVANGQLSVLIYPRGLFYININKKRVWKNNIVEDAVLNEWEPYLKEAQTALFKDAYAIDKLFGLCIGEIDDSEMGGQHRLHYFHLTNPKKNKVLFFEYDRLAHKKFLTVVAIGSHFKEYRTWYELDHVIKNSNVEETNPQYYYELKNALSVYENTIYERNGKDYIKLKDLSSKANSFSCTRKKVILFFLSHLTIFCKIIS